jgi:phosphoribosylformimino-5-aminoimidazole carboxamide ribotide isomerase
VIVIPAIDLADGVAVRLLRGERDQKTVYHQEPWRLCAEFAAAGAERLHLVDLDGAFGDGGGGGNRAVIARILAESPIPVELGGGLRDQAALDAALAAGARYAVLGTAAIKSPAMVKAACRAHPGRIIVAVDAKDGLVAVEGWTETSQVSATELGQRAAAWGAAALLYTDVSRDGTEVGPNVAATATLGNAAGLPVIASGGIGSLDHVRELSRAGIALCVVGRALYERRFTVGEAIAAAREAAC